MTSHTCPWLLQAALENHASAETAYEEAIDRLNSLIRSEPESDEYHQQLAQVLVGEYRFHLGHLRSGAAESSASDGTTLCLKLHCDPMPLQFR